MELTDFCKSLDFMKLGQAIDHNNWRMASIVLQRMQKQYAQTGDHMFDRSFINLRQCLLRREQTAAKNALAGVIARRTQILNRRERENGEQNGEET